MYYDSSSLVDSRKSTIGNLAFDQAFPVFSWLDQFLETKNSLDFFQIGSSSGREVAHYSSLYPHHNFYGTDIYKSVVDYSAEKHKLSNLEFAVAAAKQLGDFIARKPSHSDIVIFSNGSLQYVLEPHLEVLFSDLLKIQRNIYIFISEPACEFPISPFNLIRSHHRGNFSWSHNYPAILQKFGYQIKKSEIIRPYLPYKDFWPNHQGTVTLAIFAQRIINT